MKILSSYLIAVCLCLFVTTAHTQSLDKILPVRAFCIAAPKPQGIDRFVKFINEELPANKVNTLILRVDYHYQFESRPELREDSNSLSKQDVKQLVKACKQNNIILIPQINLLGHQTWATTTYKLLKVYPQFDETPHVQMPAVYAWPNADSLYCKSYCPLHPDLHAIIFDLVDEICDAFESNAFHAGMDEVFYIGDERCPRCSGKNKADLFAGEVNKIQAHLALKKRNLWIWGDRLIDGRATGVGFWEGSYNNTHPAVDLISKDVVICDWHYNKSVSIPVDFAGKGLSVITCTWKKPAVAAAQVQDMVKFRQAAKPGEVNKYLGVMQTIWSGADPFLDEYYALKNGVSEKEETQANCFKALSAEIKKVEGSTK